MEPDEYRRMFELETGHWWYRCLRELALRWIEPRHERILDAGCGTGGMLKILSDREAWGIDDAAEAVSFCRRRGLPRIARGSVDALPFGACQFDAALALNVLYHRRVSDVSRALVEIHRVLRPGGRLIVHEPAYEFLRGAHDAAVHTARRTSVSRLRRFLENSGFEVERITYRISVLFPFAVLARVGRMAARHFSRTPPGGSDVHPAPFGIDPLLYRITRAEDALIAAVRLPFGLGVFCVARRI